MAHLLNRSSFGNPENKNHLLSNKEAEDLLNDWVKNDRLRLHMKQVAYLMKTWAAEKEMLDETEQQKWNQAGLLHDADWDQWPDDHCSRIIEELERRNIDPDVIHAIASHGPSYFGVEPVSQMDKMLYAFDELSGFAHAYSLMRPTAYEGMEVKGFLKRMKDKSFASNVSRDDIRDASERTQVPVEQLIDFVIQHQAAVK